MRNLFFFAVFLIALNCDKAEPLCETPPELLGFFPIKTNNSPVNNVKVTVQMDKLFSLDDDRTYVVFDVPEVFVNNHPLEKRLNVGQSTDFYYKLKDPSNPPSSVQIFSYIFNDCEVGEKVYGIITYDTIP